MNSFDYENRIVKLTPHFGVIGKTLPMTQITCHALPCCAWLMSGSPLMRESAFLYILNNTVLKSSACCYWYCCLIDWIKMTTKLGISNLLIKQRSYQNPMVSVYFSWTTSTPVMSLRRNLSKWLMEKRASLVPVKWIWWIKWMPLEWRRLLSSLPISLMGLGLWLEHTTTSQKMHQLVTRDNAAAGVLAEHTYVRTKATKIS